MPYHFLGEDGSRDLQGGGHDQGADAVGQQVLLDDTAAGSAQCAGSGDVLALAALSFPMMKREVERPSASVPSALTIVTDTRPLFAG